ncbi:MAG: hypothetical protein JXC36_04850 [Candidatus Atribacteria bacterium]|nr:hypothetical protein [Candidatus Atribacteria bacterium]
MEDFETVFAKFQISEKTERSIKEFSNWLFGISIGLCALMVSLTDRLSISSISFIKPMFVIILVLSMVNVFVTGITKFLIFRRETRMMISVGALKKIALFVQIQKSQFNKTEWDKHFADWATEYNKLTSINKFFNTSIIMNIVTTIIIGTSVVLVVI